ncbi:hypothetical protein D3C81_1390000 [compost metagenome]
MPGGGSTIQTAAGKRLPQHIGNAIGLEPLGTDLPPLVDGTKYRPRLQFADRKPVLVDLHRTQTLQCRQYNHLPAKFSISLAAAQKHLQLFPPA